MAVPSPFPPTAGPDRKQALRRQLRAAREAFVAAAPGMVISPTRELLAMFRPGVVVAAYVAIGSEADPARLVAAARAAGCAIALPHVTTKDAPMRFLTAKRDGPLRPGPFGLMQPPADAPEVAPDIILTPLVGYDRALNRLGQGAGYYDRAFAALPGARRIGVAWDVQQVSAVPADPWDVPLHAIITETGWRSG